MRRPRWELLLLALVHCGAANDPPPNLVDAGPAPPQRTDAADPPAEDGGLPDAPVDAADAEVAIRCDPNAPAPKVRVEMVADGLAVPWSMVFLPNGDMLFTEREGRIRLLRKGGSLEPTAVPGGPPTEYLHQGGYLGLALHPSFAAKPFVYLAHSHVYSEAPREVGIRVSRFRWQGEALVDETTIFDGPHDDDEITNAGGRILFGRDGKLYVTIGDRSSVLLAQHTDDLRGKIVRLSDDGTIPADNPFVGVPGARGEIWSFGHRNPQGLAVRPGTGELYATEHGAIDHDEVNRIVRGGNFGYPAYAVDASDPSILGPIVDFTPGIAPSGATFYASNVLPGYCGDLFVAGLASERLVRVRLKPSGPPEVESLFVNEYGRIRDVAQGPDGYLYFAQDGFSGVAIRRIVPE